jgi:hypothetical protein
MPRYDSTRKSEQLQQFVEETSQDLSRVTGFVQRRSKMTGAHFLKTVVFGWANNPAAPLNELIQQSAHLGVSISEAGLQQRINDRAVVFLKALFAEGVACFREQVRLPTEVLQPFSRVNIIDSSLVSLPDELQAEFKGFNTPGSAAAAKLQLSFDYLTGDFNAIQVEHGRSPDQTCQLPLQYAAPNSLNLFDLGYVKFDHLQILAQQQAFFISRLATRMVVFCQADDQEPLDLVDYLRTQPDQGELEVYIGLHKQVHARLVFQKLPPPVVEDRRRKVKRTAQRKQHGLTAKHLALQTWNLFITNVPPEWLDSHQVLLLYRVRWQIELLFKLWKSQAKLGQVGTYRRERIVCQLYARLIALVLFNWLVAPHRFSDVAELSFPKAWRIFQRFAGRLIDAIAAHWRAVPALLTPMTDDFLQFARKNVRKKSPSTYQQLVLSGA